MSVDDLHRELAGRLFEALRLRQPIEPLTREHPDLSVEDAYRIQEKFVARLNDGNPHVVGYKVGLSSAAMQRLLGVDEPDFGPVLAHMVFGSEHALSVGDFCQPKIEAEIALVLGSALRGPGVTAIEAASAIRGAVAALEVVDSRIENWEIDLVDTVADMASSAAAILSSRIVPLDGSWEPRLTGMSIYCNGSLVDTGAGAAALGDPIAAVAWLANTLGAFGVSLEPGHIVMTGSLHSAFAVSAGDEVRAEFDRLGSVACRFV